MITTFYIPDDKKKMRESFIEKTEKEGNKSYSEVLCKLMELYSDKGDKLFSLEIK